MKLEALYEILVEWGALSPKEIFDKLHDMYPDEDADKLYMNVHSRLQYGANCGAFNRLNTKRGRSVYAADPRWVKKNYGRRGGVRKEKARAIAMGMRARTPPATYAEIGKELGCTTSAAYQLYKRARRERHTENPRPPQPREDYSVLGDS